MTTLSEFGAQVEDFFDFDRRSQRLHFLSASDPDPKPGGGGGESDEDLDPDVAKQGTEDNPGIIPSPIW